jgi:AcrR family transcriptional regulator
MEGKMYHIKQDKRSLASAELIGEAMLKCLEEKEFHQVTIVDLQKQSTVSRATFYRLFDRTEDVLEWMYERQIQEANQNYQEMKSEERPSFLQYLLEFFYENSMLVEQLIRAQKIGILHRVHQKNVPWFLELFPVTGELSDNEYDYYSSTFTALLIGSLMVWMSHGKQETPQQLYQILKQQMELAARVLQP